MARRWPSELAEMADASDETLVTDVGNGANEVGLAAMQC